jgi:hypothetical protein
VYSLLGPTPEDLQGKTTDPRASFGYFNLDRPKWRPTPEAEGASSRLGGSVSGSRIYSGAP